MTAQELHDACHAAMCDCPQFRFWDDDADFGPRWGQFGNIPKKGMHKTILFWREWGDLLWEKGYSESLPPEAQVLFENIDKVIAKSIEDYCKTL